MYSLTSANRYYLYQGFVRMNLGIDGLFKIIRSEMVKHAQLTGKKNTPEDFSPGASQNNTIYLLTEDIDESVFYNCNKLQRSGRGSACIASEPSAGRSWWRFRRDSSCC